MDDSLIGQYAELEKSHFWWVSRREFIHDLIKGCFTDPWLSVLDVGCGGGELARKLSESGARVTAIDIAFHEQWRDQGIDGPDFIEGDYLDLASKLGLFDCVLALDVVEHMENESRMIRSLKSNMRPGGRVIVTVPAYGWLWSQHDVANHHYRRYTRSQLADALSEAGFAVIRCGYIFFGLVGPKLLAKGLERLPGDHRADHVLSPPLNRAALTYFRWEHQLALRRHSFLPSGTSLVAIASSVD